MTTDDEGRFRLFGLAPGEYAVLATLRSGPATALMDLTPQTEAQVQAPLRGAPMPAAGTVGYASVYAPGVVSRAQAMTIKLAAEEERDGVTIRSIRFPLRASPSAIDAGETGDPASVQLSLVAGDAGLLTGRRGGDGRYVFTGVAARSIHGDGARRTPGGGAAAAAPARARRARARPPAPLTLYAIEDLNVTGGEMNVSLRLQPAHDGVRPRGDRGGRAAGPARQRPVLRSCLLREGPALGVPSVRSNADGVFVFEGVPPGRYRLTPAGVPRST